MTIIKYLISTDFFQLDTLIVSQFKSKADLKNENKIEKLRLRELSPGSIMPLIVV